jgi:hypothetical protein
VKRVTSNPAFVRHYYARGVRHEWKNLDGSKTKAAVSARTKMTLYTGGKSGIKRKSLIHIHAWAERYGRPPDGPWLDTPTTNVLATINVNVNGSVLDIDILGSAGQSWRHGAQAQNGISRGGLPRDESRRPTGAHKGVAPYF